MWKYFVHEVYCLALALNWLNTFGWFHFFMHQKFVNIESLTTSVLLWDLDSLPHSPVFYASVYVVYWLLLRHSTLKEFCFSWTVQMWKILCAVNWFVNTFWFALNWFDFWTRFCQPFLTLISLKTASSTLNLILNNFYL